MDNAQSNLETNHAIALGIQPEMVSNIGFSSLSKSPLGANGLTKVVELIGTQRSGILFVGGAASTGRSSIAKAISVYLTLNSHAPLVIDEMSESCQFRAALAASEHCIVIAVLRTAPPPFIAGRLANILGSKLPDFNLVGIVHSEFKPLDDDKYDHPADVVSTWAVKVRVASRLFAPIEITSPIFDR